MFREKNIRKHLIFSGRVQGVGFRYRAMNIAQMLGLIGWVKNRWDGKVEMEVQGKREEIGKLISMLFQIQFPQEISSERTGQGVCKAERYGYDPAACLGFYRKETGAGSNS